MTLILTRRWSRLSMVMVCNYSVTSIVTDASFSKSRRLHWLHCFTRLSRMHADKAVYKAEWFPRSVYESPKNTVTTVTERESDCLDRGYSRVTIGLQSVTLLCSLGEYIGGIRRRVGALRDYLGRLLFLGDRRNGFLCLSAVPSGSLQIRAADFLVPMGTRKEEVKELHGFSHSKGGSGTPCAVEVSLSHYRHRGRRADGGA